MKTAPVYKEVKFKGSISHISAFVCEDFNHVIFSSVYTKEAVSLSREMLHMPIELVALNWVADPKMYRDINRNPNTVRA